MGGHEGEFVFSTSLMSPAQGYEQLLMELEKCLGRLTGIRDNERQGDAYRLSIELCGEARRRVSAALDSYIAQSESPRFDNDAMGVGFTQS